MAYHIPSRRRRQRGMSLMFALFALVALALAAITLVRTVDTSALVIGNLGFKQDATATADRITERAVTWLSGNVGGTTLYNDGVAATGYFASSRDALDATGTSSTATTRVLVDWNNDDCAYAVGAYTGCEKPKFVTDLTGTTNTGAYVITRLCRTTGSPSAAGNSCAVPVVGAVKTSGARGAVGYPGGRLTAMSGGPYYRIVSRAVGPRGTVSFTETIVSF